MSSTFFSLGLMSGTSLDGVDAAFIQTDGRHTVQRIHHLHLPYPKTVQQALKTFTHNVQQAHGDLDKITELWSNMNHSETYEAIVTCSTDFHIQAVQALLKDINHPIDCIGYHGQTVFHDPKQHRTLQIGYPEKLAQAVKCCVVYDFRSHDMAHGGQGAPLAPIYHQVLAMQHHTLPLAIFNCGGIANVSLIQDHTLEGLFGFDTGPGNCLLDAYVARKTQGQYLMDTHGRFALAGTLHRHILNKLYQQHEPLFQHPRSLDLSDFTCIAEVEQLSIEDGCATLAAFTAETMAKHLIAWTPKPHPTQAILCGGGAYHPVIQSHLQHTLTTLLGQSCALYTADALGWHNQAIEAELMAYLAVRRLLNLPITTPKTTGVDRPRTGGKIMV